MTPRDVVDLGDSRQLVLATGRQRLGRERGRRQNRHATGLEPDAVPPALARMGPHAASMNRASSLGRSR
jgi:hypothetical protein